MKVLNFVIVFLTFHICSSSYADDTFDEELFIKPLPSGHVYTHFQFVIQKNVSQENTPSKHFRLFPRSLGEIIFKHSIQELHFSLTQGLWRYEKWGYPFRDAPAGSELWAWFTKDTKDVSLTWKNLVNVLSGQFCASLNFIDDTNTVIPQFSFRPEGAVESGENYNSSFLRYASLPPEIVCTENLTPFKKLLPCDTKAGLSTLLNAVNIFNAHFVSLAVDLRTVCMVSDCSSTALELIQSVAVVFDPPVQQLGKQDWSFVKLFGSGLMNTCPVASSSQVYVDVSSNKTGVPFLLSIKPTEFLHVDDTYAAMYDLKRMFVNTRQVNIGASYKSTHVYWFIPPPEVYVNRYITGYGQEHGGIRCTFHNNHPSKSFKILYLDVIPWFLRIYSHTLSIKNGPDIIVPEYKSYQPAKDRKRPHHFEIGFTLPPNSVTELSIKFDHAFLKWTEYPPDANHGFYVGSAVISTVLDSNKNFTFFSKQRKFKKSEGYFLRLHTQILLVSLPTPDFSMPYNVICLTCTVVALAFGPIHNMTTKSVCYSEEDSEGWFAKMKKRLSKLKKKLIKKEEDIHEQGDESKKVK